MKLTFNAEALSRRDAIDVAIDGKARPLFSTLMGTRATGEVPKTVSPSARIPYDITRVEKGEIKCDL